MEVVGEGPDETGHAVRLPNHPLGDATRMELLAKFPRDGLLLDPEAIIWAIRRELNLRPAEIGRSSIQFRSEEYPFILLTSYQPTLDSTPIPQREVYRAMSFHPRIVTAKTQPTSDHAEGVMVLGTDPVYRTFVQAIDPLKPGPTAIRDYPGNIMPSKEPDNFKIAAMRSLSRLGLLQ